MASLRTRLRRVIGRKYKALRYGRVRSREYTVPLPEAFGHSQAHVRISVPTMPPAAHFRFAEHVLDDSGRTTTDILATTVGGFAVSRDLGERWSFTRVSGFGDHAFLHVHALGSCEYLAQVKPAHLERDRTVPADLLIVDEAGQVLDRPLASGPRWHSCRAVDMANGTLMYAEYPRNRDAARSSSRVLRSRDRGRSWEAVFEQSDAQIRHFHFLQARKDQPGEWWLSSGDASHESKIWASKDDGDSWRDITVDSSLTIDGTSYPRSIFRLTDLFWNGTEVIWGTDDTLQSLGAEGGARVFRSLIGPTLLPDPVGRTPWAIRNIVEAGAYLVVLTQGSNLPDTPREKNRPGVFLMPKCAIARRPELHHLFDVENYMANPIAGKGFTYSRASRSALNGTFFTYCAPYQALPQPNQILKWEISFA